MFYWGGDGQWSKLESLSCSKWNEYMGCRWKAGQKKRENTAREKILTGKGGCGAYWKPSGAQQKYLNPKGCTSSSAPLCRDPYLRTTSMLKWNQTFLVYCPWCLIDSASYDSHIFLRRGGHFTPPWTLLLCPRRSCIAENSKMMVAPMPINQGQIKLA